MAERAAFLDQRGQGGQAEGFLQDRGQAGRGGEFCRMDGGQPRLGGPGGSVGAAGVARLANKEISDEALAELVANVGIKRADVEQRS